jgi:hypothetical protein
VIIRSSPVRIRSRPVLAQVRTVRTFSETSPQISVSHVHYLRTSHAISSTLCHRPDASGQRGHCAFHCASSEPSGLRVHTRAHTSPDLQYHSIDRNLAGSFIYLECTM